MYMYMHASIGYFEQIKSLGIAEITAVCEYRCIHFWLSFLFATGIKHQAKIHKLSCAWLFNFKKAICKPGCPKQFSKKWASKYNCNSVDWLKVCFHGTLYDFSLTFWHFWVGLPKLVHSRHDGDCSVPDISSMVDLSMPKCGNWKKIFWELQYLQQ